MLRLRHTELRRFSDAVGELAGPLPRSVSLSDHLLHTISRLIPIDRVSYNVVDRHSGTVVTAHSLSEPPSAELVASLNRHIHEHPGFVHLDRRALSPPPIKLSDYLSQRQFRSLGLYSEHFRLYRIHYQLGINFVVTPTRRIAFGLNRSTRDFSEADRLQLMLLRQHLTSAYLRAQAAQEFDAALLLRDAALAGSGAAVALFDNAGQIVYRTALAAELLDRYDDHRPVAENAAGNLALMEGVRHPVLAWVRAQIFSRLDAPGLAESAPLAAHCTLTREGRQLAAVFTPALEPGSWHLLRLTERADASSSQPLRALGLSAREAEVLFWLARGKRNAEIASICQLHPTTVSTHLRRIFPKLGVETRTAAAATAWETLAGTQNGDAATGPGKPPGTDDSPRRSVANRAR